MKATSGYTLVEISISMAILSVVSLLGWIVIDSSNQTAQLTDARAQIQANLRDCMGELMAETRQAYSQRIADSATAPEDVAAITVGPDGTSITFQVPEATDTDPVPLASAPITIAWLNEDLNEPGQPGFARLDDGEDANGDGVLNRCLVRTQGGQTRILGASNDISDVEFTLLPSNDPDNPMLTTLQIRIESAKRYGRGAASDNDNVRALVDSELVSSIHLEN